MFARKIIRGFLPGFLIASAGLFVFSARGIRLPTADEQTSSSDPVATQLNLDLECMVKFLNDIEARQEYRMRFDGWLNQMDDAWLDASRILTTDPDTDHNGMKSLERVRELLKEFPLEQIEATGSEPGNKRNEKMEEVGSGVLY